MTKANTAPERVKAVAEARRAFREAQATAEARLREQMREEMLQHRTTLDLRIREAVNAGVTIADVMRAYPTKDRKTILTSLERTKSMAVEETPAEDGANYVLSHGELFVDYTNFGPDEVTGSARFTFERWDDEKFHLLAIDELWNEDYTEKNEVVFRLDDVADGYYYDSAVAFLEEEVDND